MKTSLKQKIRTIPKTVGTMIIGGLILYNLASHNGKLDSLRSKEARKYHNSTNPIKIIENVEETWKDDWSLSPMLDGYNPRVIRKITFQDGSKTKLDYRTHAWQPFMKWRNGDEFNPKPNEKYEVTPWNQIVGREE